MPKCINCGQHASTVVRRLSGIGWSVTVPYDMGGWCPVCATDIAQEYNRQLPLQVTEDAGAANVVFRYSESAHHEDNRVDDLVWTVVEGQNVLMRRSLLINLRGVGSGYPRCDQSNPVKQVEAQATALLDVVTFHWVDHFTSDKMDPLVACRHPQFVRGVIVYEDALWVVLANWVLAAQHYNDGTRVWRIGEPQHPTDRYEQFWCIHKCDILWDSRSGVEPGVYFKRSNSREYTIDVDGDLSLVSWTEDDCPGLHWLGCNDLHCTHLTIENCSYECNCVGRCPGRSEGRLG
jgi:hypothetical protein